MNAITWIAGLDDDDDLHLRRWILAALVVAAAHASLVAAYVFLFPKAELAGSASPPVLIDFAPDAAAPETQEELAPGKPTDEAQEQQEEVKPEAQEQPILDLPPVPAPEPEIVIPPKQEVIEKKEEPKPKPPEEVVKPAKKQVQSKSLPTSAPKVQRRAQTAAAPNPGAGSSKSAIMEYRSLISAHLQRFKRPASGSGTAVVSFTVHRSGRVTARSLARSSGSATLDAEAMAMITRAQPMPAFPAAMTESSMTFTQAIKFN